MNVLKKIPIQVRFCLKWGAIIRKVHCQLSVLIIKLFIQTFFRETCLTHVVSSSAEEVVAVDVPPFLLESTPHLRSAITLKMYQNFNCSRDINFLVNLYILNCQLPEFLSILEVLIF